MSKSPYDRTKNFFGIKKRLFIPTELTPKTIERFVDRERELDYLSLRIAEKNNCAVIGDYGSGKTSFLIKLCHSMSDYAFYEQFSLSIEGRERVTEHFLRTVLRKILKFIIQSFESDKEDFIKSYSIEDIYFEAQRLEHSIILEHYDKKGKDVKSAVEAGIKTSSILDILISPEFKAKFEKHRKEETGDATKREYPVHTDATLRESIEVMANKLPHPIVLFIDELDKVGRPPLEEPEWDREVRKILDLSREIMTNNNLIFVFALQSRLLEELKAAKRNQGPSSVLGLVQSYRELKSFSLELTLEVIEKSLKVAEYRGNIEDLFEKGVIEITHSMAEGNPKLFMNHLSELTTWAMMNNSKKITLDILRQYAFDLYEEEITPEDWNEVVKTGKFILRGKV